MTFFVHAQIIKSSSYVEKEQLFTQSNVQGTLS